VPGALGLGPDEGRDKVSSPTPIARMHRADSTHGIDKIVLDNRIRCHCNFVTDAEVQVDRPGRAVLADLETPEYHAQREHDLAETLVLAIRPVLMVDLSSGQNNTERDDIGRWCSKYGIGEVPHIRTWCPIQLAR
jgi:hypothetical protein